MDTITIPLHVDLVNQSHTISISEILNMGSNDKVMLIDHHLSVSHDLSLSDYTYVSLSQQTTGRFSIQFIPAQVNSTVDLSNEIEQPIVYICDDQLYITNKLGSNNQTIRFITN